MHLLVTRPEAEAMALRGRLKAMGHRVTLAPLLSIVLERPALELDGVQAVAVTSRNAIRALAQHPQRDRLAELPMFVVGAGTGGRAREAGFTVASEGSGGGAELADIIARALDPAKGALLHASGHQIAFDLKAALEPRGFTVHRAAIYRSLTAKDLPGEVVEALRAHALDGVLLMSPRTSETWVRLVRAAGLETAAQALIHLCLSEAVAVPVRRLGPREVRVAVQPNSEEILALVEQLSSTSAR